MQRLCLLAILDGIEDRHCQDEVTRTYSVCINDCVVRGVDQGAEVDGTMTGCCRRTTKVTKLFQSAGYCHMDAANHDETDLHGREACYLAPTD